jgi:CMP-N,N'-diacetyllegionaminic acid synthase
MGDYNNILAIIPARGGSKGVKKKNIRLLNGKPLIQYTIDAAKQSRLLSRIIVSTDDAEIAEISQEIGAEIPFLRPAEFASDNSSDASVLKHVLLSMKQNNEELPDLIVYLRPTTPFKTGEMIDDCIKIVIDNPNCSGLRSVTLAEGKNHPYWMFRADDEHLVSFVPGVSIETYFQRQLLPVCYALNGMVDILKPHFIFNNQGSIYGDQIAYKEIPKQDAIDIDTELDLKWAEFLLSQK